MIFQLKHGPWSPRSLGMFFRASFPRVRGKDARLGELSLFIREHAPRANSRSRLSDHSNSLLLSALSAAIYLRALCCRLAQTFASGTFQIVPSFKLVAPTVRSHSAYAIDNGLQDILPIQYTLLTIFENSTRYFEISTRYNNSLSLQ